MPALNAGKLRHRVQVQRQVEIRNQQNGAVSIAWENIDGPCWAEIAPLSAREFVQSAAVQSNVTARITMRWRDDLTASMRIVHNGKVYNIAGVLADQDSGREYVTVPVSVGVNDGQ